jgi:hypothetical protein
MADEPTKEEIEQRARELARRVMSKPYEPQKWPGGEKPKKAAGDASKPRKRAPTGEAS